MTNEKAISKEFLAPKEMTSKELKELVDEWVSNGGKITQCAPGVALNFKADVLDWTNPSNSKGTAVRRQKRRVSKKAKSAKRKGK